MRNSLRAILLPMLLAMLCGSLRAQEPRVRASLPKQEDLWVGQRVTLVVELLAPGFFAGAPAFDLPDPPGILLVPPISSPVVGSETIGEANYTVQRHELSIFVRHAGQQVIPAITVRFRFKRQPLDKETVSATVRTEPLNVTIKVPQGAEGLDSILSARDLKAVETWQPEPGKAKPGDAFTRTITFTAPDIPAMAFPTLPSQQIEGLGIYPKSPQILDHAERGVLQGQRRDTITYMCQRPGHFVIPAMRLSWFDLESKKVQVIDFPSRTIDVATDPTSAARATAAGAMRISILTPRNVAGIVAILAVGAGTVLLIRKHWREWMAPFLPTHLEALNPMDIRAGGNDPTSH